MGNPIVWADIPVTDLARASAFYAKVTGRLVAAMPGENEIALLTGKEGETDLVSADLHTGGKPSHDGATVYLGTDGDIDGMLSRVAEAGGRILQDKQFMGEMVGWIAFIEDTEGNRIGLQQAG
jgi:predicted enzyme related to lactoylglutathione lyase